MIFLISGAPKTTSATEFFWTSCHTDDLI